MYTISIFHFVRFESTHDCFYWIFTGLLLLIAGSIQGQNYVKSVGPASGSHRLKVQHFTNGDIVIGDSDLSGLSNGTGRIKLSRLDHCGRTLWTQSYFREDTYLELVDIEVNAENEIFLFGSAFQGFAELLFLMKVGSDGNLLNFQIYETETVDRFTYSIDLQGSRIMVYGLLLDFSTLKEGFVAIFNDNLQFQWARKFSPFESNGEAIFTRDGGIIGWSNGYHYRLSSEGDVIWAGKLLDNSANPIPRAGPVEVTGGYLFEAHKNGESQIYQVNDQGEISWTSRRFSSSPCIPVFAEENGQIVLWYTQDGSTSHELSRIVISSSGEFLEQSTLNLGIGFEAEELSVSHELSRTALVSNSVIVKKKKTDVDDFLMQWEPAISSTCFEIQDYTDAQVGNALTMVPIDTPSFTTTMTAIQISQTSIESNTLFQGEDLCEGQPPQETISIDTFLACEGTWEIMLPRMDLTWDDTTIQGSTRILSKPGTYSASNQDCMNSLLYTYTLAKPDCQCEPFLPTAFSPNGDSQNDVLQMFGNCDLTSLKFTVFDRWGNQIYKGRRTIDQWNGIGENSQQSPPGVYIVHAAFEWADNKGSIQQGSMVQSVLLIR